MLPESILPDEDAYSPPSMPTMRGGDPDTLGRIDHYDLLRKLGGGGFGVVYLARDTVSGVEVALKTLHPLLKRNAEEMDLLREKFRLVSRLTHTNIAKALVLHLVREINVWDEAARAELKLSPGDSVMVMDYAPGVTLSRWRQQFPDGIVPPILALEIGRQVAAALDYAHSERIVHRDVKPGNIMVETLDGGRLRVRILDFGLAAEIRSSMSRVSTEQGDTSGTRPYMAPEQWLGRKQDSRTDQYALACVLYELLSGAPPFAAVFETGDPAVMMAAIKGEAPAPIPGLPKVANAALLCALAKDPAARFPSCAAFLETLAKGRDASMTRPLRHVGWIAAAVLAVGALGTLLLSPTRGGGERESSEEDSEVESVAESAGDGAADGEAEAGPLAKLDEESMNASRAFAKETEVEEAIRVLRTFAARDAEKAEPFRKWAEEGEFKTRFETLDGRKAVLDGCTKAADLSKAQTAAADVRIAADWIVENAVVRGELDELERALDALEPDLEEAEAPRYAFSALDKAKTAREAVADLRNRSLFAEAKQKLESARKQYEEALATARTARAAAKAKEALVDAEAAKSREDWSAVLAATEKAIEWDAANEAAKALKAEAEENLRPVWAVSATLPGGAAATGATLALGGRTHTLPARLNLSDGKSYGPGEVTLERDGRIYVGMLERTTVGWKGERKAIVALVEKTEPNSGGIARIDLGIGVSLEMVSCPGVAPDFWMGKFEVTQELWERVMDNNPSHIKGAKNPVESVSWSDCQKFIRKLNDRSEVKKSGLTFHLPTEEEWETACRAGAPKSEDYCNVSDGAQITRSNLSRVPSLGKGGEDEPTEVGKNREPNAWGLYDMDGNVWEWTETAGDLRDRRGGSFSAATDSGGAGFRGRRPPALRDRNLGFRLAASGRTAAK